jgi:hypothetical protein
MLFGDSAFSELPFATDSVGTRAEIAVGANALTMAIGVFAIQSSSLIENINATPMTLSSAFASIITNVNLTATATPMVMTSTLATASGAANINIGTNILTLATTDGTATGGAIASPGSTALTLTTTEAGVIVWNPINPNTNSVWKEIKPYGGTP